jgi:hypothetical protein
MTSAAKCVKTAFEQLSSGNLVEAATLFIQAAESPDMGKVVEFFDMLSQETAAIEPPVKTEVMASPVPNHILPLTIPELILSKQVDNYIAPVSDSAPSLGHLPGHNFYEDLADLEDESNVLHKVKLSSSPSFGPLYISDHEVDNSGDGFEEFVPEKELFTPEEMASDWDDPISDEEAEAQRELDEENADEENPVSEEEASNATDDLTGEDPSELED